MKTIHTQNLIIGFGKAGKTLAADLSKHGQEVILVEQNTEMYGGTCINIGCIPSKKLLVEGAKRSLENDKTSVFQAAMSAKNGLIPKLRTANFAKLDNLDNVQVIHAKAHFKDDKTVILQLDNDKTEVSAERVFINTGADSNHLDVAGADGKRVFYSTEMLSLTKRPKRLVIVGGGYISLEFAFMYQQFGSEVTILDNSETFLPREDRDVAEEMLRILNSKKINVVQNMNVHGFVEHAHETVVQTTQGDFLADAILVAVGRHANTQGLALEQAGIQTDNRGFIQTDNYLRVKGKDHIWAMGDVAGSPMFTYISLDDYRIVREQLFGQGVRSRDDRTIFPTTTFTEPPLSQIGMTETAALKAGRQVKVLKMKAEAIPKAKVLGQTDGLLKAIVDKDSDEILGVTLFCAEAHEMINLFKMAMDNHIPASYLKNQIFTHPTMSEGLNDLFA